MTPSPIRVDVAHLAGETHLHDATRTQIERFRSPAAAVNPAGIVLSANRNSLLRDNRHWMPVMAEMQYTRVHQSQWRDSLLAMKAGGIDIVATYAFWIHHEEEEGVFDFTGQRDLRQFVQLCGEMGLDVQLRIGPWCHGEARNGGFPDWLLKKGHLSIIPKEAEGVEQQNVPSSGMALRSDDPAYLDTVRRLYTAIAQQVRGLLWKDGGPVIGVQLENEYSGPGEHLLTLKHIAREVGLDVPLYYITGWPKPQTPLPFGELLPLYGGYAEGFWDRTIEQMPGGYWEGFFFKPLRIDATIATDHFGVRAENEHAEATRYPYVTCEIGGGMIPAYHRRVR
jgi:hypothetical protein